MIMIFFTLRWDFKKIVKSGRRQPFQLFFLLFFFCVSERFPLISGVI